MKIFIALLSMLMCTQTAFAAKIIGNGGDVLVCPDRLPKVQLLDFVEARVLRKNTVKLWNPPGLGYQDKLDSLIWNVSKRFPRLALALRAEIVNFEARNAKETDIELEDINDSYHKFRLPGCHVEQIANQSNPMFADDPWVLINGTLWNLLDAFDKAGLVIHEVLYRMGLRHGVEHSIGIRYLTGLLFQEDLNAVKDQQWIEAMLHSRMKYYETGGLRIPLFQGEEKDCELVPGSIECRGGPAEFKPASVSFNPDRSLESISFEGIGIQPFEFYFENLHAVLFANKVSFIWEPNKMQIVADGRLQIQNRGLLELALIDVRGRINPVTGEFNGEYRYFRPDQSGDSKLIKYSGPLKNLFVSHPAWIGLSLDAR